MTTQDKARLAKELLENPIFGMAISALKEDLHTKWANSDPFDKEGREAAFVFNRTLTMVQSKLMGYVQEFIIETNNQQRSHPEDLI